MRKLKKFGIGVCMAAIAASMVVTPVVAKSSDNSYYNYTLDSYTQPAKRVKNWTEFNGQLEELMMQCKVQDPASWYVDTGIKDAAAKYLKKKYYVGDLRFLTDNGIYTLKTSTSKAFNYGIVISDDINSGRYTVICKCSQSDFNELSATYHNSSKKNNFKFTDEYGSLEFSYNAADKILTVKDYPY